MGKELPARVRITALDKLSAVLDKVKNKFPELSRAVSRTNTAFGIIQRSTDKFAKSAAKIGQSFKSVGQALTLGVTLPVIAAGSFSVKAFADFETALIGVGKTTNLQGAELRALGQDFLTLSKTVPVPVEELLGLGQTAAQLGVRGSADILKFSSTLAKLSRASNIQGEEGASDLARFITVTRSSIKDVDRYASALVALGNTSAATENEILSFALRLGGSTALFNVSGQQALGIATALRSVGIEAEAGSSAVQRALGDINDTISKGGMKAQVLSQITGIAMGDLKKRFKTDAVGVLRDFSIGLQKLEKNGGDVTQAMKFFGLEGVRDFQVIGALAKNTELLDEKIRMATKGFEENTALAEEFAAANNTLANRFQLTTNRVKVLMVAIGEKLKPVLVAALDVFDSVIGFFEKHPTIAAMAATVAVLVAVIGPLLVVFGTFLTMLPAMVTGWGLLTAAMAGFGIASFAALIPFIILLAKFLLIGAVIVGLGVILYKFGGDIWNALIHPLETLTKVLDFLAPKLGGTFGALLKLAGFGTQKIGVEADTNAPRALAPNGKALGGAGGGIEAEKSVNPEFSQQTNNARVDINVRGNVPATVRSEQSGSFLSINNGMAGAF